MPPETKAEASDRLIRIEVLVRAHMAEDQVQFDLLKSDVAEISESQIRSKRRIDTTLLLASILLVVVTVFALIKSVYLW